MNLEYIYPGIARSVDSILEFTGEDKTAYWSDPIFHFFPDIDKENYKLLNGQQRKQLLTDYFTQFETENQALLQEKVTTYNQRWQLYKTQITHALQDAFETDLSDLFNDMRCLITFNSISPRYLDSHSFDVFYLNSDRGALGTSIHEIIHFVWFHVWNQVFHDDCAEYETPHLKWILSEMVVQPIMRDERLASINPYFGSGGCVYSYFYTLRIDGKPILDALNELYTSMPIKEFMQASYRFCLQHEAQIRQHIEESENQ